MMLIYVEVINYPYKIFVVELGGVEKYHQNNRMFFYKYVIFHSRGYQRYW